MIYLIKSKGCPANIPAHLSKSIKSSQIIWAVYPPNIPEVRSIRNAVLLLAAIAVSSPDIALAKRGELGKNFRKRLNLNEHPNLGKILVSWT